MSLLPNKQIQERFEHVSSQIYSESQSSGRDPESVRLVVVTKTHPVESISAVIQAGAKDIGENYAEEAVNKIKHFPATGLNWHMIGHVQSRKANLVAAHFDVIHSIDSLKVATKLNQASFAIGKRPLVFLEINVSGEESKFGLPVWQEDLWPECLQLVDKIRSLENLNLKGVMTIAPWGTDHSTARPYFALVRRFSDYLMRHLPNLSLTEYSMGMSADFKGAIAEGATYLRIGTAIMGERAPNH